ncbi:MAG TPA: universal stress protein [Candidatus Acidoferrales bacterium]|nr:universal stress protein [Candidatus Acidoferrales bacterium]
MKVLLPIDSSSASRSVIAEAAARVWIAGTTFCVLHIVDIAGLSRFAGMIEQEKSAAEVLVASAAAEMSQAGFDVSTEVLTGFPRTAVVRYAKQYGADLVMIGSHGQGSVARLLLGSVAQAALRAASCSVEIVRQKPKRPLASADRMKILLATDGSDGAMAAAKSLAARPWPAGSKIKIISVVELIAPGGEMSAASSSAIYPMSLLDEIWNDARVRAREAVADARKTLDAAGMKIIDGAETPEGDPRLVLLEKASEWDADLIVLGSHGRRGIDRMLMGSVSESVALQAPCCVEVVRE